METKRELTCIVCPRGCPLSVTLGDDGAVLSVEGNLCPRGKKYALDECTNPKRVVTTTVRCEDGGVVAVKTADSVPKAKVFEIMTAVNSARAPKYVSVGDVIISDVCGTGVDIVATANKN